MRRGLAILFSLFFTTAAFAQMDTRIVDSLENILPTQEGREKVLTMIELTWEFYDISFDDCIDWGEKALKEAQNQGLADLEAKSNYVLGIQYIYHTDLDLAKQYLKKAYDQFTALGDTKNAFESLWNMAFYEMNLGSVDTAFVVFERALDLARQNNDTSACAYVNANMGLIAYRRNDFEAAIDYYRMSIRQFRMVKDEVWALREESYLATVLLEKGRTDEARRMYWRLIPKFEEMEDNYRLFLALKNLGTIYENSVVDYDSALYYFQQAIDYSERSMLSQEAYVLVNNEKSSALVGIGNVLARRGDYAAAIDKYLEAMNLSKERNFYYGEMEACFGLVELYSRMGQAAKSLHYYERYVELEKLSGIAMMRPSISKHLAMDYARLGRFDDLYATIEVFEEDNAALIRENSDVYEQNRTLRYEAEDLLQRYEAQNNELEALKTQRGRYRLAFFGLLALVIATLVLLLARKIVQKNSTQ
jgi:tetratricopeptide (TPR) repeat protein